MSLKTFIQHLHDSWKKLWSHEPQAEAAIVTVINGIGQFSAGANSGTADLIASLFPNGIGGKTLTEVRELIPHALQYSTIASDALKASEGIEDPTGKANAVITTALNEASKLPELQKEAHLLTIISAIVAKVLHISFAEANHLVTAKQQELASATQGDEIGG